MLFLFVCLRGLQSDSFTTCALGEAWRTEDPNGLGVVSFQPGVLALSIPG